MEWKPNIAQRIVLLVASIGFYSAAWTIVENTMQIYGGTLRIVGIRDRFNPLPAVIACAVIATICLVIALHNLPAAKRTRSKAIKKEPTP